MTDETSSIYSKELCDFAKEEEDKVEKFNFREHEEADDARSEKRDVYRRDYARVLYSSSFRRLQGKMQLLGIDPTNFYRNRLTHSLEVAQIARSIATDLGLKNPIVAETCSLSHDLGNPPFGHAGEKVLNELAEDIGGYEGNAQTLRLFRNLEKKHYKFAGLNLTIRTLWGVTKYFYRKGENPEKPDKYLYEEDYDFLMQKMEDCQTYIKKSIDAQIMDLADEIAYAAHDLEDAVNFGLVTIPEIMHEFEISQNYNSASKVFNSIAQESRKVAMKADRLKTSEEYSFIMRRELTSNIVHKLMRDIGLVEQPDGSKQLGYKTLHKFSKGLKKLVFKAILRKKDVRLYEKKGEKIIKGLCEVYLDEKFNEDLILLPAEYRAISKSSGKKQKRAIIDYIAGMMDSYAEQEYKRYFGESSLNKYYDRNIWNK